MAIKKLTMGVNSPTPDYREEKARQKDLRDSVEHYLPEFVGAVKQAKKQTAETGTPVVLHQDAFAANYDMDEYTICGMAIKYAGLYGVSVVIMGTNHETF